MRKPIFDIIRTQRGTGFTKEEVKAVDELLDRLGIERDEEETAPAPPPTRGVPARSPHAGRH